MNHRGAIRFANRRAFQMERPIVSIALRQLAEQVCDWFHQHAAPAGVGPHDEMVQRVTGEPIVGADLEEKCVRNRRGKIRQERVAMPPLEDTAPRPPREEVSPQRVREALRGIRGRLLAPAQPTDLQHARDSLRPRRLRQSRRHGVFHFQHLLAELNDDSQTGWADFALRTFAREAERAAIGKNAPNIGAITSR